MFFFACGSLSMSVVVVVVGNLCVCINCQ